MNKDEALDLALEALEALHKHGDIACVVTPEREFRLPQVITAIKQARSAPVQEPAIKQGWDVDTLLDKPAAQRPVAEPHKWVHATEWGGLTDEEIKRIGKLDLDSDYFGLWFDFAKAIEAKLKAKNFA